MHIQTASEISIYFLSRIKEHNKGQVESITEDVLRAIENRYKEIYIEFKTEGPTKAAIQMAFAVSTYIIEELYVRIIRESLSLLRNFNIRLFFYFLVR